MFLYIQKNVVHLHDRQFQLKPTPCRLLALLIRYGEQVVSRQTILTEVWGYDFNPGTKIIDVQICYLRKALAAVHAPFEIKTHRGRGISLRSLNNVSAGHRSRHLRWSLPSAFVGDAAHSIG
ncbi:winged helix-turn-helix domain-containing protein [Pseudomonas sp. NPDC086566]|uniref:winged helix-turn-helix domain-containing protein n=1 Tax=Pseudomonas sp. NPDC086566 TaxID=3390647 RepID=UPI003CFE4398